MTTERERLRSLLERAHTIIGIREAAHKTHKGAAWLEQAQRELNGEPMTSDSQLPPNELTARLFGLTAKVEDGEYWETRHVAQAAADALTELDRQRAEVERLTRERDEARATVQLTETVTARMERLSRGRIEAERDRLRAALEKISTLEIPIGVSKPIPATAFAEAKAIAYKALSGEPSADETKSEWLTDEQCDDVIAFLEDYEWSGLTRENVRTWCTAIAEARSSVKASGEHVHIDECWEPDSGCDMGRNEAHAVAEERCEHGIPRRFCTAVHPSENGSEKS